jgi:hypothetical protein
MKLVLILALTGTIIFSCLVGAKTQNECFVGWKKGGEFGGALVIQQQLDRLNDVEKSIRTVPPYEMKKTKRDAIKSNLAQVTAGVQNWLNYRIQYLNSNIDHPAAPRENASMDALRKQWDNNGLGLRLLLNGVIERLDLGNDKQSNIVKNIRIAINNVNQELSIQLNEAKPTDTSNWYDVASLDDVIPDSLGDLFGDYECGPDENEMTYEERYGS